MKCPLLRQTEVHSCRAWGFGKPIPSLPHAPAARCSSEAYCSCELYRRHRLAEASGICPLLDSSSAQYCSGAAVRKFIPWSDSPTSRCHNGQFRYCELYEELAHSEEAADPVADWLVYTPNHMWLDIGEDGIWHAGVDALAARVLGPIESVVFADRVPAACITARGVDWQVTLPAPAKATACNLWLRAAPGRISTHPHTLGWLFSGENGADLREALHSITASRARPWMQSEMARLAAYPLQGHITREQALTLSNEFFSLRGLS